MRVLSGTVTSSTKIALSRQEGVGVGSSGFSVGEAVGGISVGRVKPGFVGGRVEVTKSTGASVGVSRETWAQALSNEISSRVNIVVF